MSPGEPDPHPQYPLVRRRSRRVRGAIAVSATTALAAVLVTAPAASSATDPPPDTAATPRHDCADADVRCEGTIEVPLDWDDPNSDTIEVTFAWHPPIEGEAASRSPIMAHEGGPITSLGEEDEEFLLDALGPAARQRGVILADLRGMGRSTPLDCDVHFDDPDTAAACAERIGASATFYATDQAAHDYDAIRAALGIEEVLFWGNSYGVALGAAYAARFGDRLEAVYLDGGVPITDEGYTDGDPSADMGSTLEGLEQICQDSAACRALPGSVTDRLAAVAEDLRGSENADRDVLLLSMLVTKSHEPGVGRELNAALAAHAAGDPAPLRRGIDWLGQNPEFDFDEPIPPFPVAPVAIVCSDELFPFDRDATQAERARQMADFFERERPYAPFELAEVFAGNFGDWSIVCQGWPTPRESTLVPEDATMPDVPALVVAGSLEVHPPTIHERFPRGQALVHDYDSHGSWAEMDRAGGWCPRDVMRDFLTDPAGFDREQGCDSRSYAAPGSFPTTAAELPEVHGVEGEDGTAVAAALTAATDAATRVMPGNQPGPETLAGVRGGEARYAEQNEVITLDGFRYVADAAVSGTITRTGPGGRNASAELSVAFDDGRTRDVVVEWDALSPEDVVEVTGSVDGVAFNGGVPVT